MTAGKVFCYWINQIETTTNRIGLELTNIDILKLCLHEIDQYNNFKK